MTVIDPAPRTREERAAETRALLDRLRVRNGRERWRADVYLLSGGLADALPAPLAEDAWFDVDECRAPPRERWRACDQVHDIGLLPRVLGI